MMLAGAAVEGPRERVAEVAQRPVRQPRGASRLAQHSFGSPASPGAVPPLSSLLDTLLIGSPPAYPLHTPQKLTASKTRVLAIKVERDLAAVLGRRSSCGRACGHSGGSGGAEERCQPGGCSQHRLGRAARPHAAAHHSGALQDACIGPHTPAASC